MNNNVLVPNYKNLSSKKEKPNFYNYKQNMKKYINSDKSLNDDKKFILTRLFEKKDTLDLGEIYYSRFLRQAYDNQMYEIEKALEAETRTLNVSINEDDYAEIYKGTISSSLIFPILQRKKAKFSDIDFYLSTVSIYRDTDEPLDISQIKNQNDLPTNSKLQYWNNYIENIIKEFTNSTKYQQLLDNTFSYGTGFVYVNWVKQDNQQSKYNNDSTVNIETIHPRQVFPDLNTLNIQDSSFIYIVQRISKQTLFLNKKYNNEDENPYADGIKNIQTVIEQSTFDPVLEFEIFKDLLYLNDATLVDFYNNKVDLVYRFSRTMENKVKVEHYAGIFKIFEEELDSEYYPIVAMYEVKDNRNFFGTSGMIKSLPIQENYSKLESILLTNIIANSSPSMIFNAFKVCVSQEALQKFMTTPNSAIPVQGELTNSIQYVDKKFLIEPLITQMQLLKNSLWETNNVNQVNTGQSSASQNSSSGYSNLLSTSNIVDNTAQAYLNQFILNLAKVIFDIFKTYVKDKYNLLVPTNNINNPSSGQYISLDRDSLEKNIKIDFVVKPMTFQQRDKNYNRLLQMLGINKQIFQNIVSPLELLQMSNAATPAQINRLREDNTLLLQQKSVDIVELITVAIQTNILSQQINQQNNIDSNSLIDIVTEIINGSIGTDTIEQMINDLQQEQTKMQGMIQQEQQQQQNNAPQQPQNNSGGATLQNQVINANEGINNEGTGQ